jgi:hypothetical protein
MSGCADGTVIVGQLVQGMMMICDCHIGNEKNQQYGKRKRKPFVYHFACHADNFKQQVDLCQFHLLKIDRDLSKQLETITDGRHKTRIPIRFVRALKK